MNAYKLNAVTGNLARLTIANGLEIPYREIYKVVKDIGSNGTIYTKDGRVFKLKLEQVGIVLQEEQLAEVERCKNDIAYFMEKYCTIDGKPISLRAWQKNFLNTWNNSKLK